jgi:hypothetical protein
MNITIQGEKELRKAFRENPEEVKRRGGQMMTRLKTVYQRQLIRNPWRVGGTGGGVPKDTGSLRDSHQYIATQTRLEITVPESKADAYGKAVHKNRPWLDYAQEKLKSDREKEMRNFMEDIISNLAK